jgi:hypothetical protein
VPREPLAAPDDLRKQALSQLAFPQLADEVLGVADEAPAGLEQPLVQAGEGLGLNGDGPGKPTQRLPRLWAGS